MEQFIIEQAGPKDVEVETYRELENGPKVTLFIDDVLCKDVYIGPDKVPRIACRVDLNGYTFYLFPGKNEGIPEAIANIIMTSPANSKHATYDYNNGYRGHVEDATPIEDLKGFNDSIQFMLDNNIQAARQLHAASEII